MALEIDEEGTVAQKSMQLTRQGQLDNTLLDALYPGIRVATVEIPGAELDAYGRAKVEQALAKFTVSGVEYRLIGASGSAKNGRYYAVNKEFERAIAERFQQWPEAAVTYFGILIYPARCGSRSRIHGSWLSMTTPLVRMTVGDGSGARFSSD